MKKNITMLILALIVAVSAGQFGYAQTSYAKTITIDEPNTVKSITEFAEDDNSTAEIPYTRVLVKNGMVFEVEIPSDYTDIKKSDGPFTIMTRDTGEKYLRFTGAGGFACRYRKMVGGVSKSFRIAGDVNYYGVLQIDIPGASATQDAPDQLAVVSSGDPRIGQVISGVHYVAEDQVLSVPNSAFGASEWNISLENPENFVLLQENIYTMKLQDILLQTEDNISELSKKFKLKITLKDRGSTNILNDGLGTSGGISHHQITLKDERNTDKKVTSIELSPSQLSLKKGETAQITANILPQDVSNKELTWHSSNPNLVSIVEQGTITIPNTEEVNRLEKDTDVIISATAKDGSNVVGNMTITVQPEQFTVTAESINTAWGTVNPATQTVKYGKSATLNANAQEGYEFAGWAISTHANTIISNDLPYEPTITENVHFLAIFTAKIEASVAPASNGNGTVQLLVNNSASSNPTQVTHKAKVTFIATPQNGYNFTGWEKNGTNTIVSTSNSYEVTITEALHLVANFTPIPVEQMTVTTRSINDQLGTTSPATQTVNKDTEVTVTATSKANHKFIGWREVNTNTLLHNEKTWSFNANRSIDLEAVFEEHISVQEVKIQINNQILPPHGEIELENGETKILTAAFLPQNASDQRVIWTSSAPNHVEIQDSGKTITILGKSVGDATITLKSIDGNKQAFIRVKVKAAPNTNIDLQSISIKVKNNASAIVNVKETLELIKEITPHNANISSVKWESKNTAIATVDQNGIVTGVSQGKVIIKLTVTSPSNAVKTASQEVTVIQRATGAVITPSNGQRIEIEAKKTLQLHATITPSNADIISQEWSSDQEKIATVDQNGLVTAHEVGSTTIKVIVSSKDGTQIESTLELTVTPSPTPIDPETLLPHLKNFGSKPFKKGDQDKPFIWEEMIPNANPNSFKIIVINSTSSTILESNNYSVTKNDQEGLSISFKQTGKFTVTIQFEAEGQSYFVSYDIVVE